MPHEALAPLDTLEEVEPDPYTNPATKAFSGSVLGTNPAVRYDIVEMQRPKADRPINDENQRVIVASYAGRRVLGIGLILQEDEDDLSVHGEIRVEHSLAEPADAQHIVRRVMRHYVLDEIIIPEEKVLGPPQVVEGVAEVLAGKFQRVDDSSRRLELAA